MNGQTITKILRLPDVMSRLRMSRSSIYAKIQRGEFPRPVELGPNSRGWVEAEITEWLASKLAAHDAMAGGAAK